MPTKRPPGTRASQRSAASQSSKHDAVRKSLTALVGAAAGGRRDLAGLDKAIRAAGYLKGDAVLSREDARRTVAVVSEALVDAETTARSPCCKECLHHAIDALTALVAGK